MSSILFVSLLAAASAVKYTCNTWIGVENSTTYTLDGASAEVYDNTTGSYFVLTGALLKNGTTIITNAVVAHVHAQACENNTAGGHFLKDITMGTPAKLENELWASPNANSQPAVQGTAAWSGMGSLAGFQLTGRTDVKAVIVHEYADAAGTAPSPKRVCCNLVVAADGTTAPVTTQGDTTVSASASGSDAATTASASGSDAGTTAAPAKTCSDDACCKKYESEKAPCSACLAVEGCAFYGIFNNDVIQAGGICQSTANTTSPVTHKKVAAKGDCADLCEDRECTDCLATTGCVWCDTAKSIGDKVGVNGGSTGSCSLKSCLTGVSPQTTCSSAAATVASVAVAFVAAIAML